MDIIAIIYKILNIDFIKVMLSDSVSIGEVIMPYIELIGLVGLLIGFIIYKYNIYLKNKCIYNISGELYYRVNKNDKRAFFIKDGDGDIWMLGINDEKSHCYKCAFVDYTCKFLQKYKKCPLRGKGYFIKIGDGL